MAPVARLRAPADTDGAALLDEAPARAPGLPSLAPAPLPAGSAPALSLPSRTAKRTLDLVLAGAALVLLMPLLALIAVLITRDSRGPVIFRQNRVGFGNRPFQVWKFRTMTCCEDGPVVRQARRDDPRVTRVGRFLRRSSLDELPQLVNVLRGEMSLVGPRPHAIAHDAQYSGLIAGYPDRHAVKPGITGWAQVRGSRGETPDVAAMKHRVDLDLAYIESWSILLDLVILVMTVREIFRTHRAY
ncbi:UDP-glucose:undecaprenyl-phosphate glucose-1-phosphate transferase [Methylobacterium crusticola]|uniref:UDP-glucose:undecaprenyl-phosphate glucose-1-phosphate transferase n=1 Tax=Methylobacterium crusticola TaxID=1697972 RepID=A0ABQ4QZM1_9HYPH|nr:exopolysaccharide biosynthesis polyprenyl glycosylphosphotransferase [Methylobacterium crusticola]GJD50836.1 UDP-glucose:undecaprenyl-phosphate glucose-1-phosphate transferase [Methylobacterium crusticola]